MKRRQLLVLSLACTRTASLSHNGRSISHVVQRHWHRHDCQKAIIGSPMKRQRSCLYTLLNYDNNDGDLTLTGGWEGVEDGDESLSIEEHDCDSNDIREAESFEREVEKEYLQWQEATIKCIKDLERRIDSLERERKKADAVDSILQRAQLLTSYMYLFTAGVQSATVQDWESGSEVLLQLDPSYDSAADEATALFEQARKRKRGSERVAALLQDATKALGNMREMQLRLEQVASGSEVDEDMLRFIQERLVQSASVTGFRAPVSSKEPTRKRGSPRKDRKVSIGSPASNIRKFFTPNGSMILIGRNRRGNEYLSLTKARPNDIWMHARGTPGAHILLPQSRGMPEPTQECLQLAANLAVFYSDARNERKAPVTMTEAKHVQKPRGAPLGAVKLRQEDRVINGVPAEVPDEFKEAREQSGQIAAFSQNGYRAADKSKRRKQTLATAEKARKTKKK